MAIATPQSYLWRLAEAQHNVVSRSQLMVAGLSPAAIRHRVGTGRLHPKGRGIYAVGVPQLTAWGEWMVGILGCGSHAVLSHWSAAMLWQLVAWERRLVEVTVPLRRYPRREGVVVHRRDLSSEDIDEVRGVPVTKPALTLVDLAADVPPDLLEAAVNQADKLDLIHPDSLRRTLERFSGLRGVASLRRVLDRRTFTLSDSVLERRFRPLARRAGLPQPLTGQWVNGFKVDFYWPDLRLVVETDGLRYHRTPAQQARDRLRDQVHTAAGLTPLRFTRAQVAFERGHVVGTLTAVARRLKASR